MGKGPSGNTTTTQTSTPWGPQQPYLERGYQTAGNLLSNNPLSFYPNETLAPVDPAQPGALGLMEQRGYYGSPVVSSADQSAIRSLSGQNLMAGNPYFQNMANIVAQGIEPQVNSGMEAAGRYGSGAQGNAFASALTNALTGAAYQNYNTGLQQQIQNELLAPSLANQDWTNLSQLYGAGAQNRQLSQDYLNEAQQRYAYNQGAPWQMASMYNNLIGSPNFSSTSTTQPYFQNPVGNLLGAGLGAGALYSMFGGAGGGAVPGIASSGMFADAAPALEGALLGL